MSDGTSPRRRRPVVALALLLVAAAVTALGGCRSRGKRSMEQSLLALEKNAPVARLERTRFEADLGHGPEELEVVSHRVPARDPAPGALPVVLVHGTPETLFTWVEVIHGGPGHVGLAEHREVIALEVIGHGVAPEGAEEIGFERCARFVAAAVRALGLERAHLVGSSYGGEFAWRAALNVPERFASLALLDSSGFPRRDGDWLPEEVLMREHPLAGLGWLLNSRARVESALVPHFRTLPPERTEEVYLVCGNASNWAAMVALARDENGIRADELGGLEVPTLVLWGRDDLAYPLDVYGQRFADKIPGAELVVVEEAGHYPHEERPAEVVHALERFMDGVEAGR